MGAAGGSDLAEGCAAGAGGGGTGVTTGTPALYLSRSPGQLRPRGLGQRLRPLLSPNPAPCHRGVGPAKLRRWASPGAPCPPAPKRRAPIAAPRGGGGHTHDTLPTAQLSPPPSPPPRPLPGVPWAAAPRGVGTIRVPPPSHLLPRVPSVPSRGASPTSGGRWLLCAAARRSAGLPVRARQQHPRRGGGGGASRSPAPAHRPAPAQPPAFVSRPRGVSVPPPPPHRPPPPPPGPPPWVGEGGEWVFCWLWGRC